MLRFLLLVAIPLPPKTSYAERILVFEECVRLIASLKSVVAYNRGGKITILDAEALEEIALGT